ncbi:Serine/threonine-protein kinase PknD [bioreactor metagenome]|uniref:Serine/threonine-protein kinase PknD n=1 Tax=bioreactor metagenome TaxID=1076179 RepID=A0A644WUK3_9ZZZZ
MLETSAHCMRCMAFLKREDDVCPDCGFDNAFAHNADFQLECASILGGAYFVGCALGQGGFGITYIGWDLNLEQKIAIKEFFPEGCVMRDARTHSAVLPYPGEREIAFKKGRERFVNEARALAKFAKDDGIVGVRGFVNENGTSYIIMDFIEGETLKAYVKKHEGKLSVEETLTLFQPLFQSLENIHKKGLIHRDISPDNIMLQNDGQLVLLDFGAARQISTYGEHSNTVNVKHGFAPEEQYRTHGEQGAWTDIYSLCATIYYLTTGVIPQQALERMANQAQLVPPNQLGASFTRKQEKALMKGLSVRGDQRQQNISELKAELYDEVGSGSTRDPKRRGKETGKESIYLPTVIPSDEKEADAEKDNLTQPFITKPVKKKKERKRSNQNLRKTILVAAIIFGVLITTVIAVVSFVKIKPITQAIQTAITEQELPLTITGIPRRARQLEAERNDDLRCYEITANSPDYASFGTMFSDNNAPLPSFELSVDTETSYQEKLREYVSAYLQNLTASNANYPLTQKKIVFTLQNSTNGWIATMADDDLLALQNERKNAVSLVVESIYESLPVDAQIQITEHKQSILQAVFQDEYLASETNFLSVNGIGKGYYEVSLHFPAPQYAADNAIFANDNVQRSDGKLLVYCEDGIAPIPITNVEDWEARLANSSVEELAATYAQDVDYSAYVKMLQDVYEAYAQQLLTNGEEYDAFLVYVSCGNCAKTAEMGGQFLSVGSKNAALCRNGTILSDSFDTAGWDDIQSMRSNSHNITGLREDGTLLINGCIGTSDQIHDITWHDVVSFDALYDCVVAVLKDGSVISTGQRRNSDDYCNYDIDFSQWENIESLQMSSYGGIVRGIRKDGSQTFICCHDGSVINTAGQADLIDIQVFESYQGFYSVIGLLSDGTVKVVDGNFPGGGDLSKWTDIKSMLINRNGIIGLRSDGKVSYIASPDSRSKLSYNDLGLEAWTNIEKIYSYYDFSFLGLRMDGTVAVAGMIYTEGSWHELQSSDFSDWEDIIEIYQSGSYILGLKSDGTVAGVGSIDLGKGVYVNVKTVISTWSNIQSLDIVGNNIVGYRNDGSIIGVGSMYKDDPSNTFSMNVDGWKDIVKLYNYGDCYILGLNENGTVFSQGKIYIYSESGTGAYKVSYNEINLSDWGDIVCLYTDYNYIIGLREDGTIVGFGDFEEEITKWDLW